MPLQHWQHPHHRLQQLQDQLRPAYSTTGNSFGNTIPTTAAAITAEADGCIEIVKSDFHLMRHFKDTKRLYRNQIFQST